MNIISVKQLRENFEDVKNGLKNGESFILLYRSQALAEIKPFVNDSTVPLSSTQKKTKLKQLAGGLKSNENLSPEQLNSILDSSYDKVLS